MTGFLVSLGLTRNSLIWFWGRVVSGALLVVAGGTSLLAPYLSAHETKAVTIAAVVILWFSGKYDSSPLPGASAGSVNPASLHQP